MSAPIEVVIGDITQLRVDAIVNAASQSLLGGGGVDGAIHAAAGPELLRACRALPEAAKNVRCPTGQARITPGFALRAKYVIHTVGPVWHGGERGERALLAACYRESLALAELHGLRAIAYPAISCGVFGFPPAPAARIAVATISSHLCTGSAIASVQLVAFGREMAEHMRRALADAQRA